MPVSYNSCAGGIAISNFAKVLIATEPNANLLHPYLINLSIGERTHFDAKLRESYSYQTSFFGWKICFSYKQDK